MKPVIFFLQCLEGLKPLQTRRIQLRSTPTRRIKSLSVLAGILILLLGFSVSSLSTPGHRYVPSGSAFSNTITISKDMALNDNLQQDIVTVNINPIPAYPPGQDVTFVINNGVGGANQVIKTDANGNAVLSLSSSIAGQVSVEAIYAGVVIGTVNITFVSSTNNVDPTQSANQLIVDITDQLAGGPTPDQVHAHLVDNNQNPLDLAHKVLVYFYTKGGTAQSNAILSAASAYTNANGNATISISDITAGTVVLGAYYFDSNGVRQDLNDVTVDFIVNVPAPNPPAGTPNGTLFWVSQDNAAADGSSQDKVKAHISDANGNTVADGTPVIITLTGNGSAAGGAKIVPGNVQTITVYTVNGDIEVPITDSQLGDVEVSATLTVGGVDINGSKLFVHFVSGPAVPSAPGAPTGPTSPGNPTGTTGTLLTVVGDGATADGVAEDSVKAHITDASGNPIANTVVTFTIITGGSAGATANAKFSNGTTTITGTTDANGNVDIPITDITAGNVWINASIDPNASLIDGSHRVVTFVAGPAVPSAPGAPTGPASPGNPTGTTGTLLTITQDFAAADGTALDSVNAHITDQYGNPVANQAVVFTITTGGTLAAGVAQIAGNVQTITLMTDVNGNIEAGLISPTAGTVSINAYIYGTSIIDGSAQTVTFVNKPDVTNPETKLIVIVYEALADGMGTTVVRAHVVDQNGSSLPNQDVTFAIDSGTATIITAQPVTTDANGDCDIQITSKTPGYVLITAIVDGKSIVFGSPARVKFAAINIYVPPVFTPNGDGTNDVLKPILVGISEFHYFNVYNRWGNLIFTTGDPGVGWDGTFKGVPQPVETYLWIAEGVDVAGKKIVQKGMTSLVR